MEKGFSGLYFERYFRQDLTLTNGVVERCNLDRMGVFMPMPSYGKLSDDMCESTISTDNIGKVIISNVYSLGVIISFAVLPKQFLFLFPYVEVMPNWQVIKWRNHAECLILLQTAYWYPYNGR